MAAGTGEVVSVEFKRDGTQVTLSPEARVVKIGRYYDLVVSNGLAFEILRGQRREEALAKLPKPPQEQPPEEQPPTEPPESMWAAALAEAAVVIDCGTFDEPEAAEDVNPDDWFLGTVKFSPSKRYLIIRLENGQDAFCTFRAIPNMAHRCSLAFAAGMAVCVRLRRQQERERTYPFEVLELAVDTPYTGPTNGTGTIIKWLGNYGTVECDCDLGCHVFARSWIDGQGDPNILDLQEGDRVAFDLRDTPTKGMVAVNLYRLERAEEQ